MASPAQPVSGTSWVSDNSSKKSASFDSWGSKRPRDSLEKMHQRNNSVQSLAKLSPAPHQRLLTSVRNFSVQIMRDDQEEKEEEEDEVNDIDRNMNNQGRVHRPLNCSSLCNHYPKGKASLLIFIMNVIASYGFGAAATGIINILHTKNPTFQFMHINFLAAWSILYLDS